MEADKQKEKRDVVFYVRDKKRNPYGVLLAKKNGNQILIGFAFCCPKDSFDKKLGRKIAEGRADAYQASSVVALKSQRKSHNGNISKYCFKYLGDFADINSNNSRTVKVPAGMLDVISDFVARCKIKYTDYNFPQWTECI